MKLGRYLEYRVGKSVLSEIEQRQDKYVLIHYATSDMDGEDYPQVTCISMLFLENRERVSFSIQKYISDNMTVEEAEKKLLTEFLAFVQELSRYFTFIHWNMNSDFFGFEAIENRYQRIFGNFPSFRLRVLKKIDLDDLFGKLYSQEYAKQGKLYTLYKINKLDISGFLHGKEEADLVKKGQWLDIAKSSKAKVDALYDVLYLAMNNKLKVEKKFNNQNLIFKDRIQYFINETILGRFVFWLIVSTIGALIGVVLDRILRG